MFLVALIFVLPLYFLDADEAEPHEEAAPAGASGFFSRLSWFVEGSIMFFPVDNGLESDPMPILPSLGLGASHSVTNIFRLDLTLDVYSTLYGYSASLGRPVPLAIENAWSRVTGFVLGFQAAGYFNLTQNLTLRAYTGLAVDFRLILSRSNLWDEEMEEANWHTRSLRSYFWSQGRWLLPVAGLGLDYTLETGLRVGLGFRVWMPAYRLWTGEDLPAVEGWRFGPGIRLTFR